MRGRGYACPLGQAVLRRGRVRRAATAVVVLPACSLACTLLSGVSGLNEVDGGSADAALDAPRKGDAPHPVEGSIGDGRAGADVAMDASRPDVFTDWCASRPSAPTFCSDFDTTPTPWGWDSVYTSKGTLKLDDTLYESAPYSLAAMTTAPSTSGASAGLQKAFTEPIGDSSFQFDIYFQTIDPSPMYDKIASLTLGEDCPSWALYLQFPEPSTLDVTQQLPGDGPDGGVEYTDSEFVDGGGAVTTGTWYHVEIDTTKATSGEGIAAFQVLIDGVMVLPPVTVTNPAAFGPPTIQLGLIGESHGSVWSVLVDNVTFDMK